MDRLKSTVKLAAAGIAVALLAGCATDPNEKYSFREGWRKGTVKQVVQGSERERPGFWKCPRRATEADRRSTDYVIVSYRGVSRQETRAVPLTPGTGLRADDKVYINLNTCDSPLRRDATG